MHSLRPKRPAYFDKYQDDDYQDDNYRGPVRRGFGRRKFLKFCTLMTATLALQETYVHHIAKTLAVTARTPVVWLPFSDCTGDTESFLRSFDPSIVDLIFDIISLDYQETLMVPAGALAEKSLDDAVDRGGYVCIVEGAIPTKDGGVYCTIGGKTALSIAQRVSSRAMINIAAGSCSWDGGIVAANPNPTGAVGLAEAVPSAPNLLNMPGCPVNGVNLVAAIVHYLTFGQLPSVDSNRRPLFAYGQEIHDENNCERYRFYEANQFVREWGDEGFRKGWCLLHMGCKGPDTEANCYTRNWNETSWPIRAGHHCIGCTSRGFWDENTPFYQHD